MRVLSQLIDALCCLPGIGPKSAQRIAYSLLKTNYRREKGLQLAQALEQAMQSIKQCEQCNNYSESFLCSFCQQAHRDHHKLCIVESPSDILAIEQSHSYQGLYYVLMGKISPLDGIGPQDLPLEKLKQLVIKHAIKEAIFAFSPSVEAQTTLHFIHQLLEPLPIKISQLAHGIPTGGALEFLDPTTISSALRNRAALV